jgi:hypothetical protein
MELHMHYEPDTVWGRTIAGDGELEAARCGLSLGQRRLLALLGTPRTFAALAARHGFDTRKLESDLVMLARLELVAFQRPGSPQPRTAPRLHLPDREYSGGFQRPPLPLCAAAVALGIAAVLVCVT